MPCRFMLVHRQIQKIRYNNRLILRKVCVHKTSLTLQQNASACAKPGKVSGHVYLH